MVLWSWVQYDHLDAVICVACDDEVSVFPKQTLRFHPPITFLPKWQTFQLQVLSFPLQVFGIESLRQRSGLLLL